MQTYSKLWLHFVWSTHNRQRIITKDLKQKLVNHLISYGKKKYIDVDCANGDMDHIHVLVRMHPSQSPAEIANLLKGESSNWINKNDFVIGKFAWQNGYGVFSVSESQLGKIRNYIKNQEKHHERKSYLDEVQEFMEKYGLEEKT